MADFCGLPPGSYAIPTATFGDMDEQTRQARFESMRRGPGMRRASNNKKLFITHKDLQKQCARSIQQHEFDSRVNNAELRRDQKAMEKKRVQLQEDLKKFGYTKERNRVFLEQMEKSHELSDARLRKYREMDVEEIKPKYMDIIRAIGDLSMPTSMKERLRWVCTVNNVRE